MPPGGPAALGKLLLGLAAILAAVGVLLILAEKVPGLRIGRLPGDVSVERERFRFYFPLGTSIVISVVLSLLLWLLGRR
jgi:uncharacterized protein (UPF0548 family)